jgi:RNA 2',3'-cyclic 3'-phosphodiesterase
VRLFVALDLPEAVRRSLTDVMNQLKPKCREARWVRPESMHLTLKFIGHAVADGDTQKLGELRAALVTIRSSEPVELHFRGIGFFPNERRPRVVWCGIKSSQNLAQIAADVDRVLEPLGIPRESRDFAPHLTLARIDPPRRVDALARAAQELQSADFGSARESEFFLFESKLKRSGAEYTKIESYPFAKAAA